MRFKSHIATFLLVILMSGISHAQDQFYIKKLGKHINSQFDELKPILSWDGNTLFFVRGYHPMNYGGPEAGQDIWFSNKVSDSTWGKPERFSQPINNKLDNSVHGITKDGKTLFLSNAYVTKKRMQPGLSAIHQDDRGKWKAPVEIEIENFYPANSFVDYCFPKKYRDVLLISMKEVGSESGEDLYFSTRGSFGRWRRPINLGLEINTTGNEFAPFLSRDGKFLYFASDGRSDGMGSADIYVSERLDDTWMSWSKPKNLGPSINTSDFESYYIQANNDEAYFVRGSLKTGDDNIYRIIPIRERPPLVVIDTVIDVVKIELDTIIEPIDTLPPLVVGAPVKYNYRILFDYNSFKVNDKWLGNIKSISETLEQNPKLRLKVIGHTCNIGGNKYNLELSKSRAQSVADLIQNRNIDIKRIDVQAKGLAEPVSPNLDEDLRSKNRRVEVEIYLPAPSSND